jgi:molybdopterin-containing oxidoreductase family iron-sulfur binding subunit
MSYLSNRPREKGVMEKCTFCVQRIRQAKNQAKNEHRKVRDGEIQTACQQACPTQAIVFGNLQDADSRVAKNWKRENMAFGHTESEGHEKTVETEQGERGYRVLEDLNTEPSVMYLKRVRDTDV